MSELSSSSSSFSSSSSSLSSSSSSSFNLFDFIPIDLLRLVLTFLNINEISKLDRSILNHKTRSILFNSFSGFEIIEILSSRVRKTSEITWLLKRRILINEINISEFNENVLELLSYHIHTLKSFTISDSPIFNLANQAEDVSGISQKLFTLLSQCQNLRSICFERNRNITNENIKEIFTFNKNITSVEILKPGLLTVDVVKIITENCPKLQHLVLSEFLFVTNREVSLIIKNCSFINSIGLSSTGITDESVRAILQAYPKISTFTVDGCRQVSNDSKLSVIRIVSYNQILSQDPNLQELGARGFRRVLSDAHMPPINEVISLGVVPRLIEFLTYHHSPILQYEATWALTNIASGTSEHTAVVVAGGAVPLIINLLKSPNVDVVDQATWALGNIAGDNINYRNMLLEFGALECLINVQISRLSLIRNITWTISNLCRGKPSPPLNKLTIAFPYLHQRLIESDYESQLDACFAVSYISDGENERIQAVLDAGLLLPIMKILASTENPSLRSAAHRVVGNILTGDEKQTQAVLDLDVCPIFLSLLSSNKTKIKKETCWSISNITAGTSRQIQYIIDIGLIPEIIKLGYESTFDLRKECIWCLSNATEQGNLSQIQYLVDHGAIQFFACCLETHETQVISVILAAFNNISKADISFPPLIQQYAESQLWDCVEDPKGDISNVAYEIIQRFPTQYEHGRPDTMTYQRKKNTSNPLINDGNSGKQSNNGDNNNNNEEEEVVDEEEEEEELDDDEEEDEEEEEEEEEEDEDDK